MPLCAACSAAPAGITRRQLDITSRQQHCLPPQGNKPAWPAALALDITSKTTNAVCHRDWLSLACCAAPAGHDTARALVYGIFNKSRLPPRTVINPSLACSAGSAYDDTALAAHSTASHHHPSGLACWRSSSSWLEGVQVLHRQHISTITCCCKLQLIIVCL